MTAGTDRLAALLAKYAGRDDLPPDTTIEELGLSSLDRVELMVALEDAFQTPIDEGKFAEARDIGQLRTLIEQAPAGRDAAGRAGRVSVVEPIVARACRFAASACRPGSFRSRACSRGCASKAASTCRASKVPVIFAANHQSHMDTPVLMAALPARWRYRVAPAMAKEFFKAHFFPAEHGRLAWFTSSLNYYLAALFFNAFPLPQREAGARQTLRYIGDVLEDGFSVLIFPGGQAHRHRRDRSLSSGHRHDRVAAERAGRARPDRGARSRAASHVADGDPGPRPGCLRRAAASDAARTTNRWRNRSRTRSGDSKFGHLVIWSSGH